jgi:uncharacterized ubiquitin-like protein YukD
LEDHCSLEDCKIKNGSRLFLILEEPSALILVKTLPGKAIPVTVKLSGSVDSIKEKVYEKEGIPPDIQRLIFEGKLLSVDRSLREYNIKRGSSLHLVLNLRGH